jgi:hypothetical protein
MRALSARGACASLLLWAAACAPPPEVRWREVPGVDAQSQSPAGHPATRLWGELQVVPEVVEIDTGVRPWSAYWFPLSGTESRAALAKYDRVSGRRSAAWFDAERASADRPPLPWEGRCDAWAMASLLIPEPGAPISIGGTTFEIADQQALWIHAFEDLATHSRVILGDRNQGDGTSDFNDLLPMEFHKILEQVLRIENRAFILDRDPKPPIWNTPIWGARWEIRPATGHSGWMTVSTDLYGVLPLESFEPRLEELPVRRTVVLHYDYRLRVEPTRSGAFRVVDSEWSGPSRYDHPDFVTLPKPGSIEHRSHNPEIDPAWLEQHLK